MSARDNGEALGIGASAVFTATLLAGALYAPDAPKGLLLFVAALFSLPFLAKLAELVWGREALRRASPWLSPLVLGVWFAAFGGLLVYGGVARSNEIGGGIPFLSPRSNRRIGSTAFIVVGSGLAILGAAAISEGLSRLRRRD